MVRPVRSSWPTWPRCWPTRPCSWPGADTSRCRSRACRMVFSMSGGRWLLSLCAAGLAVSAVAPVNAASADTVSARHRTAYWQGTLEGAAPLGCSEPNTGCDKHTFVVDAPRGSWITVGVDTTESVNLRVTTSDGQLVGNGGINFNPADGGGSAAPTTTFQQVSTGRVAYTAMVGDVVGAPANPTAYRGTVRLAGRAFDRAGHGGLTPGLERLREIDEGGPMPPLRIRLVADPHDAATVRTAGKTIAEIFSRINVPVKVSYDFFRLAPTPVA